MALGETASSPLSMSTTTATPASSANGNGSAGAPTPRSQRSESSKENARSMPRHTRRGTNSSTPGNNNNTSTSSNNKAPTTSNNGITTGGNNNHIGGHSLDEQRSSDKMNVFMPPPNTMRNASAAKKWGLIRKDIRPSPQLLMLSEKVQHIIHTLRTPPEERRGDVVVHQGDKGNTCFILVSGIVSVYVRNVEEQKKYQRMMRSNMESASSLHLLGEMGPINYGTKVVTLTPGATFGELCLIEPDSKRSATVIVDPQTQLANFIVLTAASYLRMTRSQTIEGTITDNIAFLQHMTIFKKWTKMQLMHLVNSMKLQTFPAGQYITHKGADADAFFVVVRGEAQECLKLTLNDNSEMSMGETRGTQHCITVELTFLGKFDVAGEYLASNKKMMQCPVDIRAVTDVDCLVLTRKLFMAHFGGKDVKKHAVRTLRRLRAIAETRETWRETRIHQALQYPNLRVPITRKLMRLSGNSCMICDRHTHVAGDELCMDLAAYHMLEEKQKKREQQDHSRRMTSHRISVAPDPVRKASTMTFDDKEKTKSMMNQRGGPLPALEEVPTITNAHSSGRERLGIQMVQKQWLEAENAGLHYPRPPTTISAPSNTGRLSVITSITHSSHVSRRHVMAKPKRSIQEEIKLIRESWPHNWGKLEEQFEKEQDAHHSKRSSTFARTSISAPAGQRSRSRSPSKALLMAPTHERKCLTAR